jgi:acid stress-induced BolA-like protein IbaG/YrbA
MSIVVPLHGPRRAVAAVVGAGHAGARLVVVLISEFSGVSQVARQRTFSHGR